MFVWARFTGHGADSGVAMEMELAHVFTLEDGKTPRLTEYFDRDEPLEAAGLREYAAPVRAGVIKCRARLPIKRVWRPRLHIRCHSGRATMRGPRWRARSRRQP